MLLLLMLLLLMLFLFSLSSLACSNKVPAFVIGSPFSVAPVPPLVVVEVVPRTICNSSVVVANVLEQCVVVVEAAEEVIISIQCHAAKQERIDADLLMDDNFCSLFQWRGGLLLMGLDHTRGEFIAVFRVHQPIQ